MNLNAPCRENDHTQCRDGTARANELVRPSRAFCEVMLKVLNRDNQLRRMCVQRRWQGLQCDRSDTYDRDGAAQRIVGANIDVTERKKAELTLAERNVQLALAGKAGLVGTYAHDFNADMMQVSEGYAAIHGLPEGTTESSRSEWKRRVHPEDLARKLAVESKAFRERRGEYSAEYRIVRHGEVRWIESRSFISYDSDGSPQRVIGVNIDITERKRAEEHQRCIGC